MAKMREKDWVNILHFTQSENWGDWSKMDRDIFSRLDAMREYSGHPIHIHCGYELEGHTNTSQHYIGNAIDCHIEGMKLIDQYLLAERFDWGGIGVYCLWNFPGLHLDVRNIEIGARWGQHKNNEGKLEYCPLDQKYLELCIAMDV